MDQNIRPIEHSGLDVVDPHAELAAAYADAFAPRNDEAASVVGLTTSIVATTDVVEPTKPFMQALAEAAVQPLAPAPQFVLVLQDTADAETGAPMIEMAGVQRPEAFDHTSPSHVVGTWIRAHLPEIVQAARSATVAQPQQLRLPDGSLVGPRTLLIG